MRSLKQEDFIPRPVHQVQNLFIDLSQSIRVPQSFSDAENAEQASGSAPNYCPTTTIP